jgi:hypothetical protein
MTTESWQKTSLRSLPLLSSSDCPLALFEAVCWTQCLRGASLAKCGACQGQTKGRNQGSPARLQAGSAGPWSKRELCEDVPFFPLRGCFADVALADVLLQVQGTWAMLATGDPLSPIDGLPPREEGSAIFLSDVVSVPAPFPGGRYLRGRGVSCGGHP